MSDEIKKNEQNNGSKKKKIIIIAVAAIVVIAAAVAAFLLLTGDDNGYVDTPVETQDAAPEAPGVEFGVFIEAGSDSPNAPQQGSAGSANDSAQGSAGGSNASQGGGSANDSSGGTGGSNGSQGGGSAQQPEEETQPAARRISINIELPNDGSADDLLFIKVNGEEQTVDGKGVACKINGQTFSFITAEEYTGVVRVEASLQSYGVSASQISTEKGDTVSFSLPLNRSEENFAPDL